MCRRQIHIAYIIVLLLTSGRCAFCQPLAWTAKVSTKAVISVASSPIGKFAAALSDDNTIVLYDVASGNELWRMQDTILKSKIGAIALSDSSIYWVRVSRESITYPISSDTITAGLYAVSIVDSLKRIILLDTSIVKGTTSAPGAVNGSIQVMSSQLSAFAQPLQLSWGINLYMTYQSFGGCLTAYQYYGQHKLYSTSSSKITSLSNRVVFSCTPTLDNSTLALSHRFTVNYSTHSGCPAQSYTIGSTVLVRADDSQWTLDSNSYNFCTAISGTSYVATDSRLYDSLYKRNIASWSMSKALLLDQNIIAHCKGDTVLALYNIQNNSDTVLTTTRTTTGINQLAFSRSSDLLIWGSKDGLIRALNLSASRQKMFELVVSFGVSDMNPSLGKLVRCTNTTVPSTVGMQVQWTMADGTMSSSIDLNKVVNRAGVYPIKLSVQLPDGRRDDTTIVLNVVDDTPPEARWLKVVDSTKITHLSFSEKGTYLAANASDNLLCIMRSMDSSLVKTEPYVPNAKFSKSSDTILYRSDCRFSGYLQKRGVFADVGVGFSLKGNPIFRWRVYNPSAVFSVFQSDGDFDVNNADSLAVIGCAEYALASITIPVPHEVRSYVGDRYRFNLNTRTVNECYDSTFDRFARTACGPSAEYRIYQVCDIPFQNKFYFLAKQNVSTPTDKDTNSFIGIQRYDSDSVEKLIPFNCSIIRMASDGLNIVTNKGIFDPIQEKLIHPLQLPTSFEIIKGTRRIAAPTADGAAIYNLDDGSIIKRYTGSSSQQTSIAVSEKARLLATGSLTGQVTMWSLPDSLLSGVERGGEDFEIIPQPVRNEFIVRGLSGDATVELCTVLGSTVKSFQPTTSNELRIYSGDLSDGVYVVVVCTKRARFGKTVIVIR